MSSPANGATVTSPVHVVASAASSSGAAITTTRIYLDNVRVYQVHTNRINTYLTMNVGSHNLTVQAWDTTGKVYKTRHNITVKSPSQPVAVLITPASATVVAKKTQQFSASVSGTSNTAVTWQVNGVSGGNSSTGTSAQVAFTPHQQQRRRCR